MDKRMRLTVFMMMVVAGALIRPVVGQTNCPNEENYEPCTCTHLFDAVNDVECKGVLMEDAARVFKRTTPSRLMTFRLHLSVQDASKQSTITIPKDLLNEHYVDSDIWLHSPNSSYSLRIAPEAFLSSRNFTEKFQFQHWDTSGLNFRFLTQFRKLCCLQFDYVSNVHLANWTSLPPLPKLTFLIISGSTGLNAWETFPSLTRGLESLHLPSNDIESEGMDRILNWTMGHSIDTMQTLELQENDLTRIPKQISAFTSLYYIDIMSQKNGIPTIPSGSIKFSRAGFIVYLAQNKIERIEPGAFQGSTINGVILNLSKNNLTRFEELVFKEMLQQMANASTGAIQADENPFYCGPDSSHLAWLIRDNPHLLDHLTASCSNGAPFHFLVNSSAFSRSGITTTKPPRNGSERPNSHHNIPRVTAVTMILMLFQAKKTSLC